MTIGAASPLWFLFAGAAATGAAYWWMSQWVKPVNLEAIMGEAAKGAPTLEFPAAGDAEPVALQALVEPAFSAPLAPAEAVARDLAEVQAEVQAEAAEIAESVADTTAETLDAASSAAETAIASTSEGAASAPLPKAKTKRAPIDEG